MSSSPAVDAPPGERPRPERLPRLHWWGAALLIYAASRIVSTVLFLAVGAAASPLARAGAHPSLLGLLTAWDG